MYRNGEVSASLYRQCVSCPPLEQYRMKSWHPPHCGIEAKRIFVHFLNPPAQTHQEQRDLIAPQYPSTGYGVFFSGEMGPSGDSGVSSIVMLVATSETSISKFKVLTRISGKAAKAVAKSSIPTTATMAACRNTRKPYAQLPAAVSWQTPALSFLDSAGPPPAAQRFQGHASVSRSPPEPLPFLFSNFLHQKREQGIFKIFL